MSDLKSVLNNAIASIKNAVSSTSQYPLVKVKSTVDNSVYTVRDMPDKQEAADLIARVRAKIQSLYDYILQKFPDKPQVRQWNRNFVPEPSQFLEATPDAEHTSYSVNKGEKVHLCLRQRSGHDETLVTENIMVFVTLHEMAHAITPSIGHGPDFWNNFAWLLKHAEERKIYTYEDFKSHPVSYCGISITDSPAYDPKKDGTDLSIG